MTHRLPDNEQVLARFRRWLEETERELAPEEEVADRPWYAHAEGDNSEGNAASLSADDDSEAEPEAWESLSLVEAFTALRHEIKLQTKGSRNLEDSLQSALQGLESARAAFQAAPAKEREAARKASLPLISSLIDLDEGLSRAVRGLENIVRRIEQPPPVKTSWWSQLLGRATPQPTSGELPLDQLQSCLQGFELLRNRMDQNLRDHEITRIDTPGGRVDPKRMTVVELVTDTDAPPETVVGFIRFGYVVGDRVVRFAEVRAAASRPDSL